MSHFSLAGHGLTVETVHRNLSAARLYEEAIRYQPGSRIAQSGALVAYSGDKTGRSPGDKRIVRRPPSEADVWWGKVNVPLDPTVFAINRERAIDYLNTRDRLEPTPNASSPSAPPSARPSTGPKNDVDRGTLDESIPDRGRNGSYKGDFESGRQY